MGYVVDYVTIREDASSTGDDNVHWQDDEVSEALWDSCIVDYVTICEDASSTGDDNVHWQDDEVSEALWDMLLIT